MKNFAQSTGLAGDDALARALAHSAGQLLLQARDSGLLVGQDLGHGGDALAQAWIAQVLQTHRPEDGFLSEEQAADPERLTHRRMWIVDPLDGTREYSEGRPDWAVHIALSIDGFPQCAAVALPAIDTVLSTADDPGLPPAPVGLKIAVSRSRPPALAQRVGELLDAELIGMGSAGWKAMAVLRGEVHAYIHAGGQYEWDSAAPVGVARAAGLHVSRIDGSPLVYGQAVPWQPDLMVCRPELAERLLWAVATAAGEE